MKVLILHLSDIHIQTGEDAILSRGGKIIDAIKNVEPDTHAVVCVISGDVTFSGTEDQFMLAIDFFAEIKRKIEGCFPNGLSFHFIAVPGNHDCDLTLSSEARDFLSNAVLESPQRLADDTFAHVCLAPLARFFDFTDAIGLAPLVDSNSLQRKLYSEHRIPLSDGTLTFRCCNTAALSRRHEQPGSLTFPSALIPEGRDSSTVAISVFHHPYNWLAPNEAREFRRRIEKCSDIILTGHEHVLDRRKTKSGGADNTYLEGGVLQETGNSAVSEFYAITIDTLQRKQRVLGFSWTGQNYCPANQSDPEQYHLWEEFAENQLRRREVFRLTGKFSEFLDDPEITLTQKTKGQLKLSDVYLFPDLKRVNLGKQKTTKIVRGSDVQKLVKETAGLFIIGDDVSGKTALAKRLFWHLHQDGDVPVLIDAAQTALSITHLSEQVERAFLKSYDPAALEDFRQLEAVRRVLIVDNYHKLAASPRDKVELLNQLRSRSFRIIVMAHDLELTFHDLSEGASIGDLPFSFYSLLPFSTAQQDRLVEKWLLLSGGNGSDTAQFVYNLERLRRTIETLVGKNYVPAYPPYLLAVLQASEAGTDVDLNASTHGYLYEVFIKASIAKRTTPIGFNVLCAYLSHIAFWMHSHGRKDISGIELRALHEDLHSRFEVLREFEKQTDYLVEIQMLARRNDAFAFRHNYILYYFLARYLSEHLSEDGIGADIQQLAGQLYKEDSANTLLFLSHLSKDKRILETLLAAADVQFTDSLPATLDKDVAFLNELHGVVGKLTLPNRSPAESRREVLDHWDREKGEREDFEETRKDELESEKSYLGRLNAAMKTIQILGQFLKNFPANLDRAEKDRVIASCCTLARRALGSFLSMVKQNETALLQEMLLVIGKKSREFEPEKLRSQAVQTVVGLCELASAGFVLRVSYALGSSELSQTYERVFPEFNEPVMRLIFLAIKLDHFEQFPESLVKKESSDFQKNPLAFRVLRYLVVRYLALFPVGFQLRQKLSQLLNLDYQKIRSPKKEQQLIKGT
jgi:hypothetical protein